MNTTTAQAARLREEVAKRRADVKLSDGRSLVVVKSALLNAEFAKLGLRLQASRRTASTHSAAAYNAGQDAGNGASFNRPVNNGRGVLAIR